LTQASNTLCCAAGASCLVPSTLDTAQSCSFAFMDRAYSNYVCPYNTNACGSINSFTVNETGVASNAIVNI